jgi:hypothetical protein
MNKLIKNNDLLYAIDLKGIALVNKKTKHHIFIEYPEAAVFLVLFENHSIEKSNKMLQSILGKNKKATGIFINICLRKLMVLNILN